MIRYSCDLCGKDLRSDEDQRFVVKIEAFSARDPAELIEADLEEGHLELVSQLLREEPDAIELPAPTQFFRFDLCCDCHRRFARDPLGKKQPLSLFTSEN